MLNDKGLVTLNTESETSKRSKVPGNKKNETNGAP